MHTKYRPHDVTTIYNNHNTTGHVAGCPPQHIPNLRVIVKRKHYAPTPTIKELVILQYKRIATPPKSINGKYNRKDNLSCKIHAPM